MGVDNVTAIYARHSVGASRFRLLKLLHREGDHVSELSIDFETHPIDEAPEYTAISHTWGGEAFDHHVFFRNKIRIPVTKSCWDGLEVAVCRSPYRLIWIDQLCIDQGNSDEKSRQIRLMDSIFSEACLTVMWLGHCPRYSSSDWDELHAGGGSDVRSDVWDALYGVPPSERSVVVDLQHASSLEKAQRMGHGFLLLDQIHEYNDRSEDSNSMESGQGPSMKERIDDIPLLSDAYAWKSLDTILHSRYFQRLWVVQEIILNKRCYLWLGWLSLPFQALCFFITRDPVGVRVLMQKPDHLRLVQDLAQQKQRLRQRANESYECLWAIDDMIARSQNPALPLVYYLYNCRSFQVSDPRHRFYSLRGLASDHESLPDPDYGLTPSASILTRPYSDEDNRIWASFGEFGFKYEEGIFRRPVAGGPASFFRRPSLSADRTRLTLPVHPIDFVAATILLDLTSQASLSRVLQGLKDHVDLGLYRRCFHVKTQGGGTFCCPAGVTWDGEHDRSCEKLLVDTVYFESCVREIVFALESGYIDEEMCSRLDKNIKYPEMQQCNHIVVTTSGRLGFVHACTKPGDVMVLIPGVGDVMVLREVKQGSVLEGEMQGTTERQTKKVYQVVGDAYLNGVMQGEAMKERKVDLVDVVLV